MSAVLDLSCELIARPSVTPDDAGCQTLLGERLAAAGFNVTPLRFVDTDNLWATHGSGAPLLALVGHTDVVPPGPLSAWTTPPFEPTLRAGQLYGRGSADMKVAIAALTLAAIDFVRAHPTHRGTLAILYTSDEEGSAANGIRKVMPWLAEQGLKIDHALIGEPSSSSRLGDRIRIGRRGSLHCHLRIRGVQGHVAYPQLARNPVHEFAPALAELVAMRFDAGNAHFPPTTMQIYEMRCGTGANNVIPGELDLSFNFRFGTASSEQSLRAQVEKLLRRHGLDYELRTRLASAPFLTTTPVLIDAVVDSIREVLGIETVQDTGGGTSDGRFIAPTGAEVVELGPVNASIHQVDECVAVADLEPLQSTYRRIIERLLANP
jgi:succinyl-diaminopimelate desuccinylase